ncbi:uncharacterized protein LOC135384982 [Ornithodoros turicata]|uniref:uncharacterized protein LOC135384982 n=1 Tax=Ornithodoros turicata TaxID=34597 RepID=UPI003139FA99
MVDRFTRWPEAVPIIDMRAETVARALLAAWICRYGTPDQIVTDRGAQFESSLFHELCSLLGTTRTRTTAYHPCANGLVERFHRQMKSCFRALRHPEKWASALPLILLHVRACLKPDLGCSAAELVFGTPLRLPADLVTQQPPASSETQPQATSHPEYVSLLRDVFKTLRPASPWFPSGRNSYVPAALAEATHVFLRAPAPRKSLDPPYTGPYRVISRSDKTMVLDLGGRQDTVSVDRVKPAFVENEDFPLALQTVDISPPSPKPKRVSWGPAPAMRLRRI